MAKDELVGIVEDGNSIEEIREAINLCHTIGPKATQNYFKNYCYYPAND